MRIYSIFDDFGEEPVKLLQNAGVEITVHPQGVPRPNYDEMKKIFMEYDGVIIGTSQRMPEDMFDGITTSKIIGTASVGVDHIQVPINKRELVTIFNTPTANALSVSEYTIGCALSCCKRLTEGGALYKDGKNNKNLPQKPDDLHGKALGVIGAGNISSRIMDFGRFFGMDVVFWTPHPQNHPDISRTGTQYMELDALVRTADVISVNLPQNEGTRNIISADKIELMKDDVIFISVSRKEVVDYKALFRRAEEKRTFYVCLDVDVDEGIVKSMPAIPNVMVTPHIAGGTISTRKRMFKEVARQIADLCSKGAY